MKARFARSLDATSAFAAFGCFLCFLKVELEDLLRQQDEKEKVMRLPGIEPGSPRWQRSIVPLDHKRLLAHWPTTTV